MKNKYYTSPLRHDYLIAPPRVPLRKRISSNMTVEKHQKKEKQNRRVFQDGIQISCDGKTGRGIFISMKACYMYLMNRHDLLDGRNWIIKSNGEIVEAEMSNGVQHGWTIRLREEEIICEMYKKGNKQNRQFFVSLQDGFFVESFYRNGQLVKVQEAVNIQLDQPLFPIKYLNDRVSLLKQGNFAAQQYKKSYIYHTSCHYYGEVRDALPNGGGVMLTKKELYFGNFEDGSLNGIGTISFPNRAFYWGQISAGTCSRYGRIENKQGFVYYLFQDQTIHKSEFQNAFPKHCEIEQEWTQKFERIFGSSINFITQNKVQSEKQDFLSSIKKSSSKKKTRSLTKFFERQINSEEEEKEKPKNQIRFELNLKSEKGESQEMQIECNEEIQNKNSVSKQGHFYVPHNFDSKKNMSGQKKYTKKYNFPSQQLFNPSIITEKQSDVEGEEVDNFFRLMKIIPKKQ